MLVFVYLYRIDINIERLLSCWNKHNFQAQYTFNFYKYTFKQKQAQATKYFEVQAAKPSVAIFKLFFADAINWTFSYLFLLASLE